MMQKSDKPKYIEVQKNHLMTAEKEDKLIKSIQEILKGEAFGVLATSENNEAYTSLISFASNDPYVNLVFATPIETTKFRMIQGNHKVSILIDNRSNSEGKINDLAAITALGTARILEEKKEIENWANILINKHTYLDEFIKAETTAIVLVKISKYCYVTSFQEVFEWCPQPIRYD